MEITMGFVYILVAVIIFNIYAINKIKKQRENLHEQIRARDFVIEHYKNILKIREENIIHGGNKE